LSNGGLSQVISNFRELISDEAMKSLSYSNKKEQMELLQMVVNASEADGDDERIDHAEDDLSSFDFGGSSKAAKAKAKPKAPVGTAVPAAKYQDKKRSVLFKKWYGI
jgi:ribosomal protein L5